MMMTRHSGRFAVPTTPTAVLMLLLAALCCSVPSPAAAHIGSGLHEYAYAVLDQPAEATTTGNIKFNTYEMDGAMVTNISGVVSGLTPNAMFGLQIHSSADFSNGCASTGELWNAGNAAANSTSNMSMSMMGDVGSVEADENGVGVFNILIMEDVYLYLFEVGNPPPPRSFVIQERHSNMSSGNTGGERLRCGEIFTFSPLYAMANLTVGPAENISALVLMTQDEPDALKVQTIAMGIPMGSAHGWHIHADPASDPESCGAPVTGGHYNPLGLNHSEPAMPVTDRHMGDFGNLVGTEGMVNETYTVEHVYLWGAFSVMDRAWVLHAGEDDLGQGGDAGSLATGNAGDRIKCGTIEAATAAEVARLSMGGNYSDGGNGGGSMPDDSSAARLSGLLMPVASLLLAAALALH